MCTLNHSLNLLKCSLSNWIHPPSIMMISVISWKAKPIHSATDFSTSMHRFHPHSNCIIWYPSTNYSTSIFQLFHENLLYGQVCPSSGPFFLRTLYCVIVKKELLEQKWMLLLHFLHWLKVDTTYLCIIVVASCSKKIKHTFSCTNM